MGLKVFSGLGLGPGFPNLHHHPKHRRSLSTATATLVALIPELQTPNPKPLDPKPLNPKPLNP